MDSFWVQSLFVHLWQRESCHGGEECRAHGNNPYGSGGNVFVLYEFIDYVNSYIYEFVHVNSYIV